MTTIPSFVGFIGDTSTSLFSACSSTETVASGNAPLSCGDSTRCVTNPVFSFITGSSQTCLCPLTSYPLANGTCQSISGSTCQADLDCNTKTFDCVGINGMGMDTALLDFLTPIVLFLCQLALEYNFQVPIWACTESQCNLVGTGTPSIIPVTVAVPEAEQERRKREVNEAHGAVEEDLGTRIMASLSRKTRSETESVVGSEFSVDETKSRQKRAPLPVACSPNLLVWDKVLSFFLGSQTSPFQYNCDPVVVSK
ncbi:uncharacterized protein LOC106155109 [Lingula anatina]|uniref:Uncharacterized protein LOC106155109 n=1 Tax=Lingula anatina TaxID=7574 RepID=A0A1S3HGL7_LINAN|nr:uncharacterized protein LOC106155109 [Lingula anatina]|eukprot:XP_013385228.1 uncharacterized protein LOC106155109 [Lingula anatina]